MRSLPLGRDLAVAGAVMTEGPTSLRATGYAAVTATARAAGQYVGCEGSIWLTHAATPPPTCTASE